MESVELLEKKLKQKTKEMMSTPAKYTNRRRGLMAEMQSLYRQIKTVKQQTPNG